ncbi:MAG: hypothetical protein ACRDSE_00035 [Pseudonocardiaceae bacterium]
MGDHTDSHARLLDLIATPGVVEILLALHRQAGSATLAQLRAGGVARRTRLLRRLIAAGHVRREGTGGTLDIEPTPDATFVLSTTGEGIVNTLIKISGWGQHRSWNP